MNSRFYHYELPTARIAQWPRAKDGKRSDAKLLHAHCAADSSLVIKDRQFFELTEILRRGDLLVLNNSEVLPLRFFVALEREVEVLLLRRSSTNANSETWEALARPMRVLKQGREFELTPSIRARVQGRSVDERRLLLELEYSGAESLLAELCRQGNMPIPPYIRDGRATAEDREHYQTVFCSEPGSVAAPTAALHFTKELLTTLQTRGVELAHVTLHVGAASFLPLPEQDFRPEDMPVEFYSVPLRTRELVQRATNEGRRIIAVGTTVARTLESAARHGVLADVQSEREKLRETNLFIEPGFPFQVVQSLITNFHQPGTTHLALVSALVGRERIAAIYEHALGSDYRFLSYGDSMFLEQQ